MSLDNPVITVANNSNLRRYEVRDGGDVIGFAQYRFSADGRQTIFFHTEVDEAWGGRGLAGQLVRFALDDVQGSGNRIVPECPYIRAYVGKHHDYDDIVDLPGASV